MSVSSAAMSSELESGPFELRVPLFESTVAAFEEDRRYVVADLGCARAGTVDLFSRFRCRLLVIDLPAALDERPGDGEPDSMAVWLDRLLAPIDDEPLDLILCWNLLNYLSPDEIRALSDRLAGCARPCAGLHALIEYSARHMPSTPWSFAAQGRAQLTVEPASGPQSPAPRYSPKALEKQLQGFGSERTMLLGNGMQEFLYRRQ